MVLKVVERVALSHPLCMRGTKDGAPSVLLTLDLKIL